VPGDQGEPTLDACDGNGWFAFVLQAFVKDELSIKTGIGVDRRC
jgi:hypothetical protein